jgi:hypothetical protein
MASEILGLFTSPEQYRAQQQQQDEQQALLFARMNPIARADYGAYLAGSQTGQGLNRLFGVEDPQLKLISQRQMLSQEIDPSNPESIFRVAQKASQLNDQPFALQLSDYARKAQSEMALAQQRTREGRAAAIPKEAQLAQMRAELLDRKTQILEMPDSPDKTRALAMVDNTLAGLQTAARQGQVPDAIEIARERATLNNLTPGTTEYNSFVDKEINRLSTKNATEKRSAFAQELLDAGLDPESTEFKNLILRHTEAQIKGKEKGQTTEVKLTLPGQTKEGVKGVSEFRKAVIDTVKPFRDSITATDQAIQSINDSLKTGNFISFNAARTQLAKAFGDNTLSRKDVEQAGGDPSILGGLADTASTMFTGTPTADTQKKIKATLMAIRKVAREKGLSELSIQRQIAQQSGYDENQMKTIFNFPEFEVKGKAPAPEAMRTNETISPEVASRITQVPAPAPAAAAPKAAAPKAPAPPKKGQKQTRTLKSGKTVTVETE